MRILLDLQGAQSESRFRGIGRYTLSLAKAIVRQRGVHDVTLALSDLYPDTIEPIRGLFDGKLPQDKIRVWQTPGPLGPSSPKNDWRRVAGQRVHEAFLASLQPDIVHVSNMLPGQSEEVVASIGAFGARHLTTMTLYDLIPLHNRDNYLASNPAFERSYLESIADAKRADGWLAISESSARDGRDFLGLDSQSVVNISAACDTNFKKLMISRTDEERLRAKYGLSRPYVMYSGGSDSRKNLDRLVRAYAQLPSGLCQTHQLVLVGKMPAERVGALKRIARAAGLRSNDLLFTGYVEDDDLVLLYNLCNLFVLPSTHEGFGLPALEAMSCGAAVIGSNLTSLPEVIGWPEALFDPFDTVSMTAMIARALRDSTFRGRLLLNGAERASRFSWEETGARAIAAFERFHALAPQRGAQGPARAEHTIQQLVGTIRNIPGRPTGQDLIRVARAIAQNHPEASTPRLLVDVSELVRTDAKTGIQRVVRNLLAWLPSRLPVGHQLVPVYATTDRPGYRYALASEPSGAASLVVATDMVLEPRPGDIFLALDLQPDVVYAQAAFYDELRRLGIPVHFVVYDLLPVLMPEQFPPHIERVFHKWLQIVCRADGALCISRAVADELQSWIRANGPTRHRPFHIRWFHLGADMERSRSATAIPSGAVELLGLLASRPTFVVVGTLEPRKGHARTLDAIERLWGEKTDINLVFVGKQGWQVEELVLRLRGHPEMGRRLFWLDGISDEYLDEVYRTATCLIVASEGEGFGLPLIEAARHGTPIFARDIPVFREVAGEHAFYFNDFDPAGLADALRQWLELWSKRRHPRPNAMTWLTWEQSAAQVSQIIYGQQPKVDVSTFSERSP